MKSEKAKIILVVLLFAVTIKSFPNTVDIETARRVAQNFINLNRQNSGRQSSTTMSDVVVERFEDQNSFYVVNFREGGWVMVSAEDSTIPVLAFSDNGTVQKKKSRPVFFCWLTDIRNK